MTDEIVEAEQTSNDETWLRGRFSKQPAHIQEAAMKALTFTPNKQCFEIVKQCRALAYDKDLKDPIYVGNLSVHRGGTTAVRYVFYHHLSPIVKLLLNSEGIPAPRGMVNIGLVNSKSTRAAVNGICAALGLRFYCWVLNKQLYAIWVNEGMCMVHPIDPTDHTYCTAG